MAKEYSPEELVTRTFMITMIGIALFIASVFVFIIF
jgi:hypothetical protein